MCSQNAVTGNDKRRGVPRHCLPNHTGGRPDNGRNLPVGRRAAIRHLLHCLVDPAINGIFMSYSTVELFRTDNLPGTVLPDEIRDVTGNSGSRKPDFVDRGITPLDTDKPEPEAA